MSVYVPHRYQLKAIATTIRAVNLALFLDPGMGKTSIIVRAVKSLQRMQQIKAALVVAPLRPCYTVWPKEVKKWSFARGMKVSVLHGPDKERLLREPADIYVINPEGLKWLFTVALKGVRNWPFDMLVVDESGKFRNPTGKRLRLLRPRLGKFKRRVVLNGTPAPNSLMDLWAQFFIVDQGAKFGRTITAYRQQYFKKAGYMGRQWEIAGEQQKQNIYRRASNMCLVMEAQEYLDMPEIVYSERKIILPPKARQYYNEAEKELFTEIDNDAIEIKNSAVATGACRQIANGAWYHPTPDGAKPLPQARRPYYEIHNAKLEDLVNLSEELAGKPLLIAYDFHHDLVRIRNALMKEFRVKSVPHIGAGVSPAEGEKLEALWNAGKLRWLLGHPDSISHGLNLQEGPGADIAWFAQTWDLEKYLQYVQRIYRQGFKGRCVRVHHLVAENTVDEVMMSRVGVKAKNMQDLKDALKRYREMRR